jgi:Phytanoyl-CoA dioxygenase (PhyH)
VGVDVRTRVDGDVAPVDPPSFFGEELPAAFREHQELIAPGAAWIDPPPLTMVVDGQAWTLTCGDPIGVAAGDGGATTELTGEMLTDLVTDQATPMAWMISQTLAGSARLELLLDWWVLLRAALDGRAPYVPGSVDFDGLDLTHTFRPDDPVAEMRGFLEQAGFLHLEGLFTEDEMAAIAEDIDRAEPTYEQGDGRSWWARTDDGTDRCVRMQHFTEHSPTFAGLLDDPRFLSLGDIPGDGHQFNGRDWVEALVKPIGVVAGISDVPWHKDCANGRHSYGCCSMTVGISVTGADAESGQLRVVAGSNRALVWPSFVRPGADLPHVDLPTATGDVTLHLSCTTHMAQPPVVRERKVLYTSFRLPAPDPEAAALAQQKLRAVRESAPLNVSQLPAR